MGQPPGQPREDPTPPDVRDPSEAPAPDADGHGADPDGSAVDTAPDGPPEGAVGVPDALERLWTPHRRAYIGGQDKPTGPGPDDGCPFCAAPRRSDEDALIIARGELVYAVLNLYPYNSGHVLVCPYRHLADLDGLDAAESAEFTTFTQLAMRALRSALSPHGFNLGINQGAVAGAGIAAHLHQHVIPRWGGDANFMPVIARTRVLPDLLRDTRAQLSQAWPGAGPRAD